MADIVRNDSNGESSTATWLEKAASINSNDGSAVSVFVRAATKEAAINNGFTITDSEFQQASDDLAQNVITDIIARGEIPSTSDIVETDVAAIVEILDLPLEGWAGTLGGWLPEPLGGLDLSFDDPFYQALFEKLDADGFEELQKTLGIIIDIVDNNITGGVAVLKDLSEDALDAVLALMTEFIEIVGDGVDIVDSAVESIAEGINEIIDEGSDLLDAALGVFDSLIDGAWDWFYDNTNGVLAIDDNGEPIIEEFTGQLILNSGVNESDFDSWLEYIGDLTSTFREYQDLADPNGGSGGSATGWWAPSILISVDGLAVATVAAWIALYDPLVLDLDGDGIETVSVDDSKAEFDLFIEEGYWTNHGWVSGDDGLLALDKNGNGSIDDISELFGDRNTKGFDALAVHDENQDNVIDSQDLIFEELLVWQDKNGDGVSSEGELSSLSDLGIASISLASVEGHQIDNGNVIADSSTFTYEDGTEGEIADVYFSAEFAA